MNKLAITVALLAISCGHIQYITEPQQASSLGDDFTAVFQTMETKCEVNSLPEQTCAEWSLFENKFQLAYIVSAKLFQAGAVASDEALQEQALITLSLMVPELYKYANIAGVKLQSVK